MLPQRLSHVQHPEASDEAVRRDSKAAERREEVRGEKGKAGVKTVLQKREISEGGLVKGEGKKMG